MSQPTLVRQRIDSRTRASTMSRARHRRRSPITLPAHTTPSRPFLQPIRAFPALRSEGSCQSTEQVQDGLFAEWRRAGWREWRWDHAFGWTRAAEQVEQDEEEVAQREKDDEVEEADATNQPANETEHDADRAAHRRSCALRPRRGRAR